MAIPGKKAQGGLGAAADGVTRSSHIPGRCAFYISDGEVLCEEASPQQERRGRGIVHLLPVAAGPICAMSVHQHAPRL